jgi:hypothetical protein
MLLTLYCFILAVIKFLSYCCSCCENSYFKNASEYLTKRLFFADWLTLTRESYMEFLIAGIITWKHPYYGYYGDCLSLFYSVVALFLALVFLPYIISILSDKRYQALLSADYKDKYGALYQGLRLRNRKSASYLKSLTARRIIFCFLVMFMRNTDVTGLQWVLIVICATLLPSLNNMSIRVNHARWQNRLELFNEWICGSVLIYSCLFTDVHTPEMRYFYGWHVVIITGFGLFVNAIIILHSMYLTG